MSNLVLIPENLMALSQATVTAASEASASMADDNLLTEAPSEFWRSTSNAPAYSPFYSTIKGNTFSINALAIVGHNLIRGDQYRIFLGTGSTLVTNPNGYVAYNPTSTIAGLTSNTTSTFADVDNGEATPGASFATPITPSSAWTLGVGFNTPATTPEVGTDLQAFWVYVKCQSDLPTAGPTITAKLCESGGVKTVLATRTIRSTTGQWMCFPWNASALGTASGANVECQLTMSAVSGAQYVSVGSIVWAEDCNSRAADSGWLTYTPFVGSGITYKPEVEGQGNAILYQFPSTYTPYFVHVHFRSSRSPTDYDDTKEILPTLHGYVQVGCLVVGESWSPAADRNFGPLISTKDWSSKSRTYGGQRFGSRRFVQRVLSLPMDWLTPEEAHTLFDRILWRHGILKQILVSILPGDATEGKHTTFLASLRNPENAMVATTTRGKSRSMTLEFEEEL